MNKIFFGIFLALASISLSQAQTVASIGIGKVSYSVPNHKQLLSSEAEILNAVNNQFRMALLDTRKFNVFDNAQLIELLDFRVLDLNSFSQSSSNADDFLQAGIDYILTADIVAFDVYTNKSGAGNTSTGLVEINMHLKGIAHTTQDFETRVITQVPLLLNNQSIESDVNQTIQAGVKQVVDQIVTKLFPIRIVQIYESREQLKLNYGSGLLSVGDTVYLYEELKIDKAFDETGEAVKRTEIVLEVVSVDKRFAIVDVLGGFDRVEKRMIGQLLLEDY